MLLVVFLAVGGFVFLSGFTSAVIVTFILPESYASTARVHLKGLASRSDAPLLVPTEVQLLRSEALLGQVVEKLDLNTVWGARYLGGSKLKTPESRVLLQRQLKINPLHNTSVIEIQAYSEDKLEAAQIANSLAEIFCALPSSSAAGIQAEIMDHAQPSRNPARPNKPLNILIGGIAAALLGLIVGGAAALVLGWILPKSRATT